MLNQTVFLVTFSVCLAVCIPLWIYIARKNPNPRFRPRPGELLLLAILMVGVSGGISIFFTSLFGVDDIVRGIDGGPPPTKRPVITDDPATGSPFSSE